MFILSDIIDFSRNRLQRPAAGQTAESVDRLANLPAGLPQTMQEQGRNDKHKQQNPDRQHAEESVELPFPDRRKRNIPIMLDTRSKKNRVKTEQMPYTIDTEA